jgi:hypothetical protein
MLCVVACCDPIRQNLRGVYDNGKKMVSTDSGSNVEDLASFFANVFGGECFMDYCMYVPSSGLHSYIRVFKSLVDTRFVDRRDLADEGCDQRGKYHVVRG